MKHIFLLSLLCSLHFMSFAQSSTVTVNATGTTGSYKTGYINNTATPTRNDGDLQAHFANTSPTGNKRGWAVFNVPGAVPPAATVTAVKLRFTINTTANGTNATTVGIYGYVGDLSTVTAPATVFADCNGSGTYSGVNFCTTTWGGTTGTDLLTLNASGIGFVNTNAASILSLGWQCNSNTGQTYTITGEGGTAATQPQLQITYNCSGVTGVSASVAPNPVCVGSTVTLTGAGTGTTHYSWAGPGGYTSTLLSPSFTASATSAGVYTLTAYNAAGCYINATTTSLTVNPLPAVPSGPTSVCVGSNVTLSDASGAGTWVSSNSAIATIGLTTGVAGGVTAGTVTTTFTLTSTGCKNTGSLTVLSGPLSITGPNAVCVGSSIALSDPTAGGTWASTVPSVATVNTSGIVTGLLAGNTVIKYSNGCGTAASLSVTVNPLPAAITGITSVCVAGTTSLSDATGTGTWSSSNITAATADPATGVISGVSASIPYITYTLPTGCFTTTTLIVNAAPVAIAGPTAVCYGLSIALSDASTSGSWSSAATSVAAISSTGVVTGSAAGTAVIHYSNGCGADATSTITVNPLPQPITGVMSACELLTTTLSDADAGGTWSSGSPSIATAGTSSGVITGVNPGTAPITYTLPTTCIITATVTITPPPPAIIGSNSVCVGQTISLTDAVSSGIWTSSNTTLASVIDTSGIVTGVSMGSAVITYQIGTGCIATQSVLVNPLAPVTGIDSMCKGSNTYLADIIGGGTWASDFAGIASIDPINGHLTAMNSGTANITYTTPAGCMATHSVTVIALPAPISGIMHTCPGAITSLSDTHTGGIWNSLNTSVATVSSSGVVHGIFADTTTITYTVMPGCTVSASLIVNPLPAPVIGDTGLCATIIDTLHDATPGGVWSTSTPLLATVGSATGIVTALAGGSAVINYTLPATGCKVSDTIVIHPLPVPVITYNFGTETFYTDTGYATYQWYDSLQGLIPGATSPSLAALYTEYYYVVVTDGFGCVGTSVRYHFDASVLNTSIIQPALVNIFPNPVTAIVHISAPVSVLAVISSIDGRQLIRQPGAKEIDISALVNGIYFISLYDGQMRLVTTRKLIKE